MSTRIGKSVPRRDALGKVTGETHYVDDVIFPGMFHGVTVRTPIARGRLKAIHFEGDLPWSEFTVVTAKDIPGENVIALLNDDQPCLVAAGREFRHAEEPVVLLAHPDKQLLARAREHVRLEVETLPAVNGIDAALAARDVVHGVNNVFKEYLVEKGDIVKAFSAPDIFVVEGVYETGAQEQLYIEPNGMIAVATANEVTVWGSMQSPYYVQKALMRVFKLQAPKMRVIQLETGGGFGGKEEYPSMIAAHAALLALKSGRPVKMIYDRTEDMLATSKRHPSRTRHRTAVKKDGTIAAMDIDFILDGGAYSTLSPVVLARGTVHAAGPYQVDHVRIRGRAVATSTPPHGAFRGLGAPQSIFALERHLDQVARAVGIAPEELRSRNFVKKGGTLATGQEVRDNVNLDSLLIRALAESDFHAKQRRFVIDNADPARRIKRGIGLAAFMHGTGFTGGGEEQHAASAGAEALPDGRVRILASSTEVGQGTSTVFAQIAAEALGVDESVIEVAPADTGTVPDSGPSGASRTTAIVGKLVADAARGVRDTLLAARTLREPYTVEEFRAACTRYVAEIGPVRTAATYSPPPYVKWDAATFRGDAYGSFSWAVYVAQVAVDLDTYECRVEDLVALQEVGRVINPTLAAGQIEGGVAQAIGWALYENVVWKDGRMANPRMLDYIMPTSVDLPNIKVIFEEAPYAFGAFGAKGIGELPMDGPAPAILNAIQEAIGVNVTRVPATPEVIHATLEAIETAHGPTHVMTALGHARG